MTSPPSRRAAFTAFVFVVIVSAVFAGNWYWAPNTASAQIADGERVLELETMQQELPAQPGATFTVNSTADVQDANPGNGVCETAPGNGVCTLRAAITEANTNNNADTINLPEGTYTITLTGANDDANISGDLDITTSMSVVGAGAENTIIQGAATAGSASDRVLHIRVTDFTQTYNMSIAGVTIRHGNVPGSSHGGGLWLETNTAATVQHITTLDNVVVTENRALAQGGGIYYTNANSQNSQLIVTNSTISNNVSLLSDGGGIFNYGGSITIDSSTISGNTAEENGGGICNRAIAGIGRDSALLAINSTVSGNSANAGGGIYNGSLEPQDSNSIATFRHSTFSGNSATKYGGIFNISLGAVTGPGVDFVMSSSVMKTGASGINIANSPLSMFLSEGYNLINDESFLLDNAGDQRNTDPLLGPLQNNGGPTLTHALLPDSPAINAGNPAFMPPPLFDQRGPDYPRIDSGRIDKGSFEVRTFQLTNMTPANGDTNVPLNTAIVLTFNEPVVPATVTSNSASGPCTGTVRVSRDFFASCIGIGSIVPSNGNTVFTLTPSVLLDASTTYMRRVTTGIQSAAGTPLSAEYNETIGFTTAGPTVVTAPATLITTTSATLNGSANPNGDPTTVWYRYSTTNPGACSDNFGTKVPADGIAIGSGTMPTSFPLLVSPLTPGTTYYYCAIAQNSFGTGFGALVSFTTNGPPAVTTGTPTLVTTSSATLNASAIPNGLFSTGWFRYANTNPGTCNDSFGTRAPLIAGHALGNGTGPVSYSQAITGLSSGTTYFYCAIANNSSGTSFGAIRSFVASVTVSGKVAYENAIAPGTAVPNVELSGAGTPPVITTSDAGGAYVLSGFGGSGYVITPSRAAQPSTTLNGIFANDAALIARHIVGLTTLSETKLRAAMVSGGPMVTSFDAGLIARYIVGLSSPTNQTGMWKFTPANRSYPFISASEVDQDFAALLMGDVSGDWTPLGARPSAFLRAFPTWESVLVSVPYQTHAGLGTEVTVPLRFDNVRNEEVTSFQFDIEYDPVVVTPAKVAADISGTLADGLTVLSNVVEPGLLKVVVFGAIPATGDGVYVNLRFNGIGDPGSSSKITINGFRHNDGTDPVITANGVVTITSRH